MEKNVGNTDRIVRIVLAIVFLLLAAYTVVSVSDVVFQVVVGGVFVLLALIMAFTSATKSCPIYSALGVSTNK